MLTLLVVGLMAGIVGMAFVYTALSARTRSLQTTLGDKISFLESELSRKNTEIESRIVESRAALIESKERENASVKRGNESEARLRAALEERGQLKAQVGRLEELKTACTERDNRINTLSQQITQLEKAKTAADKEAAGARAIADSTIATEREATEKVLAAKTQQIRQLEAFIATARDTLGAEFRSLSAQLLKDASDELVKTTHLHTKHHDDQVAGMLKPVKDTIERLDQHVTESNQARAKAETLLDDQVKRLAGATDVLTNALKKPVMRGTWGETQLENALDNAGLEPELDYVLQHTTDTDDGKKRTDAVINLPRGRKLIVDSKNLMESYYAFSAAEDPTEKAALAEAHSRALRTHIKALSSKEYWRRYEGLDCVILFIPHDGMYHAAISDESDLIREASDRRVFISNPMSLIPLLKAVRYVMDQDRLNKSAAEISVVGSELYGEITRFAENFANIGNRLKATVTAYNGALPGLDRFIVSKSRRLKQLGAAKGDEAKVPETMDLEIRQASSAEFISPTKVSELLSDNRQESDGPQI